MSHRLEHLLPNGLLLLVEPLARLAVATHLVLPVGTAHDARGAEGTARLLHAWCQRGAGGRDTRALNEALENLGAARGRAAGDQLVADLPRRRLGQGAAAAGRHHFGPAPAR